MKASSLPPPPPSPVRRRVSSVVEHSSTKGRRQNSSVGNCKILQTFANIGNNRPTNFIPGLPTFSQQWQKSPFSRCPSNDILITLTAHKMGHVG